MSKVCIFCGRYGKLSKEHIWPEWMHKCLPFSGTGENTREINTFRWRNQTGREKLQRQGHLSTIKLRVVCRECNNGWMSIVESEVKPILTMILMNEQVDLNTRDQYTLAKWIVMKVITGEHAEKEISVTPGEDRLAFKNGQRIPEYYSIYIGTHNHESDAAWLRISQTMALSTKGPNPPLKEMARNTQSVAFLCGSLYVFVFAVREIGIDPTKFFNLPKLQRIFPSQFEIVSLPSKDILSSIDMGKISWALDDLMNEKNVKYMEYIPNT